MDKHRTLTQAELLAEVDGDLEDAAAQDEDPDDPEWRDPGWRGESAGMPAGPLPHGLDPGQVC